MNRTTFLIESLSNKATFVVFVPPLPYYTQILTTAIFVSELDYKLTPPGYRGLNLTYLSATKINA